MRGAEPPQREIALDEFPRAVADHGGAAARERLEARGEIDRVPDRRVLGVRGAGLDGAHHDLAGIGAGPDLDRRAALGPQAIAVAPDLLVHAHGGIERALRVVLVRHRRAEQREDAVAGRLHDIAVIAARGVDHQRQSRIDDRAGFLRIEVPSELGRSHDVDEQSRDQLPLAVRHALRLHGRADGDGRPGNPDRRRLRGGGPASACCACTPRAAPHVPQNLALLRLDAPQAGQAAGSCAPQASQNLAPSGLSHLQLGHCMGRDNSPGPPPRGLVSEYNPSGGCRSHQPRTS